MSLVIYYGYFSGVFYLCLYVFVMQSRVPYKIISVLSFRVCCPLLLFAYKVYPVISSCEFDPFIFRC